MKSKKRIIINYFLRSLQDKMQCENSVDAISSKWLKIYSKEELKGIVKWLFMQKVPEEIDLDNMDEEELLETIGDEYHILGYLLHTMQEELHAYENPTPVNVWNVLEHLAKESHYLATKVKAHWDDTDRSNYKALARKAGNAIPLYGVFDVSVSEDDKYVVTLPDTLYESSEEALQVISELISKGGFQQNELKVMML